MNYLRSVDFREATLVLSSPEAENLAQQRKNGQNEGLERADQTPKHTVVNDVIKSLRK